MIYKNKMMSASSDDFKKQKGVLCEHLPACSTLIFIHARGT